MFSKYHEQKGEEGFTLIELLVVIIIIGILAAIAIPTFLGQRERARRSAAQSDLRNFAVAAETYFTDLGVYPAGDEATVTGYLAAQNIQFELSEPEMVFSAASTNLAKDFCAKIAWDALPEGDGGAWYFDSDDETQLTSATDGSCADD